MDDNLTAHIFVVQLHIVIPMDREGYPQAFPTCEHSPREKIHRLVFLIRDVSSVTWS